VPGGPIAYDRREFSHLDIEAVVFPRRVAHGILIGANLAVAFAGRIVTAIRTSLGEEINLRPNLYVEIQREPRIEEEAVILIDQSGGRLLDVIFLQVERTADPPGDVAVGRAEFQMVVEEIEKALRGCRPHAREKNQRHEQENRLNPHIHA
jgi:hypothetical protein